jgi:hypothetical protein
MSLFTGMAPPAHHAMRHATMLLKRQQSHDVTFCNGSVSILHYPLSLLSAGVAAGTSQT